jgi:outer membrane usher protein
VSLTVDSPGYHLQTRRTTTALAGIALCLIVAVAPPSFAADNQSSSASAPQTETLVLRVNLNTENKGDLFVQCASDLDFLLKLEDLKAIGFRNPVGTVQVIEGEPHLSLRSMLGVSFTFDGKALALNITAEPQLLPASSFALLAERRRGTRTGSTNSAFLNYALTGSGGSSASSSGRGVAGEMGVRWEKYLFLSDASTIDTAGGKKFVRLMSSVTNDDQQSLRRVILGDVLTPSRDLSSGLNLGGISITKVYGIDPYFVRFPTQTLSGSVALPSDMEVYLDGQRIRTERLRPGEFELRDILAYGGAQNVQVILRDAFGRVQQLSYSLYFSDQPLQKGLQEYSYNFGAIRRQYGADSNRYGPAALTFFHRYGFTNAVTLGWRAEATRQLVNTGPTATVVLGTFGVVNLALARSAIAGRQGTAELASYSFQSKDWSLGLFLRHDGKDYASMGDPPVITNRKYEGSASASYRLPGNGSVSLGHTALKTRSAMTPATATPAQPFGVFLFEHRRHTTLSYSTPLGSRRMNFTASLSHMKSGAGPSRNEVFLGLNVFLDGDYSAAASVRRDRQNHSESLQFTKNQPIGEGLGYMLSLDGYNAGTQSTQSRSQLQYNAPAAVLRAEFGQYIDQGRRAEDQRVSVAGGVVYAGGHFGMSRPISDSYAIVKVGDVAGVGISVDGQAVGKTDSKGLAVLPTLNAYYENSVSISPGALPMEYALPATVKRVSPLPRSGAFVDFEVTKTQAFSGKLISRIGGTAKAVEFQEIVLNIGGKLQRLPTGRGGEFYVENLAPGSYPAVVSIRGQQCLFDLNIPKSDDMFVDLGGLDCSPAPKSTN